MAIHIVGDSHAAACFSRVGGVDIHWRGPITMHRVGRDGAEFLLEGMTIAIGDVMVFVFGEIDIRAHVGRIAEKTARSEDDVIAELVNAYIASIQRLALAFPDIRIVLTSVIPPAQGYLADTKAFPVHGTLQNRIAATRSINTVLAEQAAANDFAFLDFFDVFADRDGAMKVTLSDGTVHVSAEHTEPIRDRLAAIVGESLAFLPLRAATSALGLKKRSRLGRLIRKVKFATMRRPT